MTKVKLTLISLVTMLFSVIPGTASPILGTRLISISRVEEGKTLGAGFGYIGINSQWESDREFLQNISKNNGGLIDELWATSNSNIVSIGYGVMEMLDIAVSLPVYFDITSSDLFGNSGASIGDLSVITNISLTPPSWDKIFSSVFRMDIAFPTGSSYGGFIPHTSNRPVSSPDSLPMFTTNSLVLSPKLTGTFSFNKINENLPLYFTLTGGVKISTDGNIGNIITYGTRLTYGLNSLLSIYTFFGGEIGNEIQDSHFFPSLNANTTGLGGIINTPVGVFINFEANFGVGTKGDTLRSIYTEIDGNIYNYDVKSRSTFGGNLAIGWAGAISKNDKDNDSIRNSDDLCPNVAEDYDGFKDDDGCPELDNDNDGLTDGNDKCPNEPEDIDGFEDNDGCPDLDNDRDSIVDALDKCPNEAETYNKIDDEDGCPELDIDNDGIDNSIDKCPNKPEDIDGYEDADGCPDPDNDKDGIIDLKDGCPNDAETFNNNNDEDGCPDADILPVTRDIDLSSRGTEVLHGVAFLSGSATMTDASEVALQQILGELLQYPKMEIVIRGYTDSSGDYNRNVKLSFDRAESVKQFLVKNGVKSSRMKSIGYGPNNPIADNRDVSGRKKNRRIEIVKIR